MRAVRRGRAGGTLGRGEAGSKEDEGGGNGGTMPVHWREESSPGAALYEVQGCDYGTTKSKTGV